MLESLFIKFQAKKPAALSKNTPTHVFSGEYCKILKNSFFNRTLLVAASALPKTKAKRKRVRESKKKRCIRDAL